MTTKGKPRTQWFLDGQPCPKCEQLHETDRCAGHTKSTGKACRSKHIAGGTVCYQHGGATRNAKNAAAARVAVAEVRGFLATAGLAGAPAVDYLQALEELLIAKYAEVNAVRAQVRQLEAGELVWGRVESSRGGQEGRRRVERAGLNVWVSWMHTAETQLLAIVAMCDRAGMTQKRKEYLERVGGSVALAMKALVATLLGRLAELSVAEQVVLDLQAAAPDLMRSALLTLDPSQQLPGGN